MKTKLLIVLLFFPFWLFAQIRVEKPMVKTKTTFAVVIDKASMEHCSNAVAAYRQTLEQEGLGVYILTADPATTPDQIRTELLKLYHQNPPLEGAVFVGDIPIPMLRDAQHMSSAFKMNQSREWTQSSIPSDRFYDDFALQFKFIKRDSVHTALFYYSLKPQSAQILHSDIYSARIKPIVREGKDKYEELNEFFHKAVLAHKENNPVNQLMMFRGHGYNSDALESWSGEQVALREQLPSLFKAGSSVKFLFHNMDHPMKYDLLSEVQRDDLDIALFHEHGSEDLQYLNAAVETNSPTMSIENVKSYLRSKLRSAKDHKRDVEKAKAEYMAYLDVPESWFKGALEDSVTKADSLEDYSLDIHLPDVYAVHPNARFVMFDACFNGSFKENEYIAGAYVFGGGKTIIAQANTVNSLQDKWPDEFLGLLAQGVRVGNWGKHLNYLESHLIGDPTFRFTASTANNINESITLKKGDVVFWKKLLLQNDPNVQALALRKLYEAGDKGLSSLLKKTYFNSPYFTVRMEALKILGWYDNADFHEVLKAAISDPYELIRRFTERYIASIGSDELLPAFVSAAVNDQNSARVQFHYAQGQLLFNPDKLSAEINKQIDAATWMVKKEEMRTKLLKMASKGRESIAVNLKTLQDSKLKLKARLNEIRELRNMTCHYMVPEYIKFVENKDEDPELRLTMVEALSWYSYSYNKDLIIKMCDRLINDSATSTELKDQALKTKNMLNHKSA